MRALVDEVAARLLFLYPVAQPTTLEPAADGEARAENATRQALLAAAAETSLANALALLHEDGDVSAAYRLLLRVAEGGRDRSIGQVDAEEILWSLVAVCRLSGRPEHRESLERYVAESGALVTSSVRTAVRGLLDPAAEPGWLRDQIESLDCQADPAEIVRIAGASALAGSLPDCRQALRRVACPDPVGPFGIPGAQAGILLALEAYQTGQWDEADRLAGSTADQCAAQGYPLLHRQAQTVTAFVAAARGDATTAQAVADEIARWAAPRGLNSLLAGAQYARVLVALGQSDLPGAYHRAPRTGPAGGFACGEPFTAWALLDAVETALRADQREEAEMHVEAVRQSGLMTASPRMALVSTAAMAMTAPDEEAPALFEQALASEDAGRCPFDRARVHLLAGERLRRMRAVREARAHLGTAHDDFRRLGALTWAQRAATGLRAVGLVPPGADIGGHQILTARELKIARLAAEGLSNKEIGDRLFMSHRTVASHLYRMFPKLGITSRAALGTSLQSLESESGFTPGP
jgi:DNA-binding CsgD family transcriptional regulator